VKFGKFQAILFALIKIKKVFNHPLLNYRTENPPALKIKSQRIEYPGTSLTDD
jgi:hypothetical protein